MLRFSLQTVLGDCEIAVDESSQLTYPYISVSPVTPASSSSLSYKTLGKEDPGGHVKDKDGLGRQPQAKPDNHRSKPSKKSHHKPSKHHLATESPLSENSLSHSLGHVTSVNVTSSPSQVQKSANKISSSSKLVLSSTTQLAAIVKKEPKTEDCYQKATVPLSPSSSALLPKQKKRKKDKHKLERQQSTNLTKPSPFDKSLSATLLSSSTTTSTTTPPPLRRTSSSGAAETTKNKSDITSQTQSVLRNPFPVKTTSESVSSEKPKKREKKSKKEKAEHSSVDSKPKPAQAAMGSFALSQSASDGIVSQKATHSEFLNRPFQKPLQSSSTSSLGRHVRPAKLSIQTRYNYLILKHVNF